MPQIKIERAWWRPAAVISSAAVAIALTTVPTAALADEVSSQPSEEPSKQEQVISESQDDSTPTSTPSSTPVNNEGGSGDLVDGVNGGASGSSSSSESGTKPDNMPVENGGSSLEAGGGSSSLPSNGNTNEGGLSGNESSEDVDGSGDGNINSDSSDSVADNTGSESTVTGGASTDTTLVPDGGESAASGEVSTDSAPDSSGTLNNAASASPVANDSKSESTTESDRTIEDGFYVIGSGLDSTKVIDVVGGNKESGTNIQIFESNGTDAQKWEVIWHEEGTSGYYTIGLAETGLVLDVENADAYDGANVWLYEFNGTDAQKWAIKKGENGLWSILSFLGNYCLDVRDANSSNGTKIWLYSANGTKAQGFNFYKYNPTIPGERYDLEDGVYIIHAASSENDGMVLDVDNASFNDSANVQLFENNQSVAQRFYFEQDGDGYYTITNLGSGKVLDVAGAGLVPTTNIQQYGSNNSDAQKWVIIKDDTLDCFYLVNKLTGLALDVSWGNYTNYNNVWGYTYNRTEGQRWTFTKSDFIENGQIYVIYTTSDTSKVLDIQDASSEDGASLQAFSSNNTLAQRFQIQKEGDVFRIRTASSGGWLTVSSGNKVVQWGERDDAWTDENTWRAVWKNGFFSLISALNDSYALTIDANGAASVRNAASSLSNLQHFIFRPARLISDGYYQITSALDENLALDVSNGTFANQSNVQIFSKNDTNAQKFHIVWTGDGYVISAARSNYAVDAEWAETSPKTNVWLYEINGTRAQKWQAEIADGGGIIFLNDLSKLALDVEWGEASSGTNVWLFEKNYNPSQIWRLSATTVPYGWVQESGTWKYYDRNGNVLTDSIVAYNLYQQIKNESSETDYLIAVDAVQCHVVLFQGSAGNWELVFDALAGTGDPYLASTDTDGYGVTGEGGNPWGSLRGYFRLGGDPASGYTDSNGRREYDGGSQLKWFRSIYGEYGFHSTCGNYSDPSQVGKRLSHGCIRLLEEYAKAIYDLPTFTRVIVLPRYNGDFQIMR